VQSVCSRGTFCKLQRNYLQEPVGEDFSGNQLDQLSGFIGLHWTASLTKQASVKSKHTPSSLQATTPSANFNHKLPGHRSAFSRPRPQVARCLCNQRGYRPPHREQRLKLRIIQAMYLQSVSIKARTIHNRALIVGIPSPQPQGKKVLEH
jgi:hypothetical protein